MPFLTALRLCGCEKQPGMSWLLWDLGCAVSSEAGVQGSEPGASPALTDCVWAGARALGIWAALVQNSVFSMLFSMQKGEECVCVRVHNNPGERNRLAGRRGTSVPSEFGAMRMYHPFRK